MGEVLPSCCSSWELGGAWSLGRFAFALLHHGQRTASDEISLINKATGALYRRVIDSCYKWRWGSVFSPWLEQNKVFSGDVKEERVYVQMKYVVIIKISRVLVTLQTISFSDSDRMGVNIKGTKREWKIWESVINWPWQLVPFGKDRKFLTFWRARLPVLFFLREESYLVKFWCFDCHSEIK